MCYISIAGSDYECADSLMLLKKHKAPVVWVDSWDELQDMLDILADEPPQQTYYRRFVSKRIILNKMS